MPLYIKKQIAYKQENRGHKYNQIQFKISNYSLLYITHILRG